VATTDHLDEEIDTVYEVVYVALQKVRTRFMVLCGDFNGQTDAKMDNALEAVRGE
jgi:hypothetical protein